MLSRRCPNCKSTDMRVDRTMRNLALQLLEILLTILTVALTRGLGAPEDGFFRLTLRCRTCDTRFKEYKQPRDDPHACSKCGYILTGNTSGICPECGTPLTDTQRSTVNP